MEKILYASFAILISLFLSFISTPTVNYSSLACSETKENVTGAACSVAELNSMSKYKYAKENSITEPPSVKDLRPVKLDSSSSTGNLFGCKLGLCITERIFKNDF